MQLICVDFHNDTYASIFPPQELIRPDVPIRKESHMCHFFTAKNRGRAGNIMVYYIIIKLEIEEYNS